MGIAAFSSLQEIKLLRLQDGADEHLLDFIYNHSTRNAEGIDSTKLRFDWESACSRAVTNLGIALLDSQCTAIRFIGPQISPEATLKLLQAPSTTLAAMGSRLTSLDINFHSSRDITATMSDLSSVFHRFFTEAKNLVAIHIGFPPKTPLDLSLESIFHNIRWKTLRTLSLQGWRLSADELTSLIHRHRRQLRDFRLSAVYLRPSGQWKDVLRVLRDETERLDRVELREIDYTEHFDALARVDGIEVFDHLPLAAPPSSISFAAGADPFITLPPLGPGINLPPIQNTIKRVSVPRSSREKLRTLSVDELGDNGCVVQRDQAQFWAAWVMSGLQRDTNGVGNGNGYHAHGNGFGNGNGNGHFHAYHI